MMTSEMVESVPRHPITVGSTRWIVTLAAITALIALSIDMSLPAQPTLATVFGITAETANLNLSMFMIGFAIAQLLVGYLADAWGRRRVLLGGLGLFSLSALACTMSPTIEVLLVCRVLQGIGGSAAPVVARAMVRDTQPAAMAARLMSAMLATLAIAPMIAPTIGGGLLATLGWRSIFATLAACGITLITITQLNLVETLPPERRLVASPVGLLRGFKTVFTTRGTLLPMLIH
jgi:DHA1 family bicyclomycin/chloramphenicol resistance-like MFS transporter